MSINGIENDFIFFSAIVPYYVTVMLTYYGVTEDAISSVGAEETDVAGMDEAGSGVDLDLSILDIDFSFDQPMFPSCSSSLSFQPL